MKDRLLYIDLIKAFAMFAVVYIHAASPILYQFGKIDISYWSINNIYNSMMRMAVPLFFMASGALVLNSKQENLSIFFKKRLLKVVIPLIAWSLIYIIFKIYVLNTNTNILEQLILAISKPVYGHLWFLYDIIGLYLFLPILKIFIHNSPKNFHIYYVILWIFSVAIIPLLNKYTGLSITNHMPMMTGYVGYLILGYLLSQLFITRKILYISIGFIFISTLVTILGTYNLSLEAGKFIGFFYSYLSLSTMIQAISYFIVLKYIGENINMNNIKVTSTIITFSATSFGIYLIHPIMLWILRRKEIGIDPLNGDNPIYMVPLTAILAFFMSFFIIYIIQKIPFIKKIVP